ncbi:MAG: ribbon-helix-helix domain-containing protein [Nanoarchaeota archaeon]
MKERITITVDKELLRWLDEKVGSKTFANRSHGFEFLVKSKITAESSIMNSNFAKNESER